MSVFATKPVSIIYVNAKELKARRDIGDDDNAFLELNGCYNHTSKVYYESGFDTGKRQKDVVAMDSPIRCRYEANRNFYSKGCTRYLGTVSSSSSSSSRSIIPNVEMRGITLRQLRAVYVNIERRCTIEGWKNDKGDILTPDNVNMYDVNRYIIKPFTCTSKKSFVESLPSTAGTQPPRWYISHWWGDSVKDFISCLETHMHDFWMNDSNDHDQRGGGMTIDTPVWVDAFAHNQWNKNNNQDTSQLSLIKVMDIANGRMISILDKNSVAFQRIQTFYDLYLALTSRHSITSVWAIYTAYDNQYTRGGHYEDVRNAVGIISGDGATADRSSTVDRERLFPLQLILQSLGVGIENAKASVENDRVRILNTIAGRPEEELHDEPFASHENYDLMNILVRAAFASSMGILQTAHREGGDCWARVLDALSKGIMTKSMKFHFNDAGWDEITTEQASQLIASLPLTLESLTLRHATFGYDYVDSLAEWIEKNNNIKGLDIWNSTVGDRDGGKKAGSRLARALASNSSIIEMEIIGTDLIGSRNASHWADAMTSNTTLKALYCGGLAEQASRINQETIATFDTQLIPYSMYGVTHHSFLVGGIFTDGVLSNDGMKALAAGIASNQSLEKISFDSHGIGKDGIAALNKALLKNKTITELKMRGKNYKNEKSRAEFEVAIDKFRQDAKTRNPKLHIHTCG